MKTSRTIIFAGGGTLGPVTPLLAVADSIRRIAPDARLLWVGTRSGVERPLVEASGIPFRAIPAGKFRRYLSLRNVSDVFRIAAGFVRAVTLLRRERPCAVVSAGGYVAVPVAWAASLLRIPVHVHQQDWRPGLANRLSVTRATSVSVALEKSVGDFGVRAAWTGNPVRPGIAEGSAERARAEFGIEPGLPVLLVLGGGTGASALNALVEAAAPTLVRGCRILHVTGPGKCGAVGEIAGYRRVEFVSERMGDAYAVADLVVTRAGMGTLTELASLGKPAVIVPMPGSHQEDNARAYVGAGAAERFDGASEDAAAFASLVLRMLGDADARARMGERMRAMHVPDAADRVAGMVLGLCPAP